ncbi:MAG: class I SAM-dependent methyltransferase [Candidatus Rokubacteria bacterium]|nr:class I SAM-dependent methyltransferase [Candidatus Rokubacteria bacterium]
MTTRAEPGVLRRGLFLCLAGLGRAFEGGARLFSCAATGLLTLEDLRRAIRTKWRDVGAQESPEYIASGLMKWEDDFYSRFLEPGDRVFVVGCGTGRDLLVLLQRGHPADGIDLVPECTAIARRLLAKRGLGASVLTGAIETTEIGALYDAIILSWFCYGYIPESATRIAVLRKLRAALRPGGRILLSYIPLAPPRSSLPMRLAALVARVARSGWLPEAGDEVVVLPGPPYADHYAHRFTREGLEAETRAAGLTVAFHEVGEEGRAVLVP